MKSNVELTASARRRARESGLEERLAALRLGEWVGKGDFVELAGPDGETVFIVRARRVRVATDGGQALLFELDHPPRPPLR